ncbi:hypothetical protein BDZ89DRAFT_416848 [Hymenopellis radicata]|nr:hypothetical protein BDZ89DRAFT_416848 [Hymenopellis radicata]
MTDVQESSHNCCAIICNFGQRRHRTCDKPSPYQPLLDGQASRQEIEDKHSELKAFVDTVRKDLYDVESRVEHLRAALAAAELDRDKVLDFMNVHTRLNPPIHGLPPEILSLIFSFTFNPPFRVFDSRASGPWLLGKVCGTWRKVAWETPTLWKSFVLCCEDGRDLDLDQALLGLADTFRKDLLQQALTRSGQTPLTVVLETYGNDATYIQILTQHLPRVTELRVSGRLTNFRAFGDAPPMALLAKLNMSVHGTGFAQSDDEPETSSKSYFDLASTAPQLTHVVLNIEGRFPVLQTIRLPWPQLTHLHLQQCDLTDMIHILALCPHLVSLIDSSINNVENSIVDNRITLPHLTFISTGIPLLILPYLTCPALEVFALKGYFDDFSDTDSEKFGAFVGRSRFRLQEVRLTPEDSSALSAAFRLFIASFSHVPRLEIDVSDLAPFDMVFAALKCNTSDQVIVFPELQVFTVRLSATSFMSLNGRSSMQMRVEETLIEVVESRWRVGKIKTVGIKEEELHTKLLDTELVKRMRVLKDDGLDVSVWSGVTMDKRL